MQPKKRRLLEVAFLIVGLPTMLVTAVGGATYLAYRDNRMHCDSPLPASKVRDIGVEIPEGATVCARSGSDGQTTYRVLASTPSPICLATGGNLGCASTGKIALQFVTANTEWGTGNITSDAEHASVELVRRGEHAHLRLHRSRYGEISGDLDVRLDPRKLSDASK